MEYGGLLKKREKNIGIGGVCLIRVNINTHIRIGYKTGQSKALIGEAPVDKNKIPEEMPQ